MPNSCVLLLDDSANATTVRRCAGRAVAALPAWPTLVAPPSAEIYACQQRRSEHDSDGRRRRRGEGGPRRRQAALLEGVRGEGAQGPDRRRALPRPATRRTTLGAGQPRRRRTATTRSTATPSWSEPTRRRWHPPPHEQTARTTRRSRPRAPRRAAATSSRRRRRRRSAGCGGARATAAPRSSRGASSAARRMGGGTGTLPSRRGRDPVDASTDAAAKSPAVGRPAPAAGARADEAHDAPAGAPMTPQPSPQPTIVLLVDGALSVNGAGAPWDLRPATSSRWAATSLTSWVLRPRMATGRICFAWAWSQPPRPTRGLA